MFDIQRKNRKGCSSPDLAAGAHDHYEDRFDWRGSYSKCHQHPNIISADLLCVPLLNFYYILMQCNAYFNIKIDIMDPLCDIYSKILRSF